MRTSKDISAEDETPESGTVAVTRIVESSPGEVWRALTDPRQVAQWFGTLSASLRERESVRLDFGDGDFFDLDVLKLGPPFILTYSWRFLGIGPLNLITWEILPRNSGCMIRVTDQEVGRGPQEADQLRLGWMDFTRRLVKFLKTGKPTRYSWRRDFEASIEISSEGQSLWDLLFEDEGGSKWLPLEGTTLMNGARLLLEDDCLPNRFIIEAIRFYPPDRMRFRVTHEDWQLPTQCCLSLNRRNDQTILRASQTDWQTIGLKSRYQKELRARFAATWIAALRRAQQLVEQAEPAVR